MEKLKARQARKLGNLFQLMRWKDTDKFSAVTQSYGKVLH